MDELKRRLVGCFQIVFPALSESEIPSTSQATLAAWDSIAAITMVNVLEDEFQIQMDFEQLADLDSFERILAYLAKEVPAA